MPFRTPARRQLLLPLGLALVLGVVGVGYWSQRGDDGPAAPDWSALTAVQPQVDPARAPLPDEQVWALSQLDPCALAGAQPRAGGGVFLVNPGSCTVRGDRPDVDVAVVIGSVPSLGGLERRDIGGHAGWVADSTDTCAVVLPVRDQASVIFSTRRDCRALVERARTVVRRWAGDSAAWVRSTPIPHACQLAASAELDGPLVADDGKCVLSEGRAVAVDLLRTGGEDDVRTRIAGQPALRSFEAADSNGVEACSLRWERPSPVAATRRFEDGSVVEREDKAVVVSATADDCAAARRMAARLVRADRAWTPGPPPRVLFQRYDEGDPTGPDACRILAHGQDRECAPATTRAVPADPIAFLRQGEADPDVVCTAALAVARDLGVELEAATVSGADPAQPRRRSCVLVDGDHTFEIDVAASREPVGEVDGTAEIAGHVVEQSADGGSTIALGRPEDRGSLYVEVRSAEDPAWVPDFIEELTRQVLD